MKAFYFSRLLIYFLILNFSSLTGGEFDWEFQDLQCCKSAESRYELSWEAEKGANYLFFTANDWQELMPLSSAEAFLASPYAQTTFILSTENAAADIDSEHKYLRIIAQRDAVSSDFVRLMWLRNDTAVDTPKGVCNNNLPDPAAPKPRGWTIESDPILQYGVTFDRQTAGAFARPDSINYYCTPPSKGQFYSPEISEQTWKEVAPYLLPENHELKAVMDKFCSKTRILSSADALKKAGFTILVQRLNRGLIVASHPKLHGFLIKAYLDTSTRCEWPLWALRAEGSRHIQRILDKNEFNRYMKVPEKWIYAIPQARRPLASEKIFPKDFILLVKDMRILSKEETLLKLKKNSTRASLKALYTTIVEGGLSDSHLDNIPYSSDNRIAFIDTEYYKNWPVHPEWLTKYLSPMYQLYWEELISQGVEKVGGMQ